MDWVPGVALALAVGAWAWRRERFRYQSDVDRQTTTLAAQMTKYLDEMTRQSERATQLVEAVDLSCARLDKLDVALRDHITASETAINDGIDELLGAAQQVQDAAEQGEIEYDDTCPNSADGQHHPTSQGGTAQCSACGIGCDQGELARAG